MEAYIRGLIPNLAQLRDMPTAFVQMYCRIAARKFFFFCDPHRRGIKTELDLCSRFVSKTTRLTTYVILYCLSCRESMHKESIAEQLSSRANGTTSGKIFNIFLHCSTWWTLESSVMLLHTRISHDFWDLHILMILITCIFRRARKR